MSAPNVVDLLIIMFLAIGLATLGTGIAILVKLIQVVNSDKR